jgi:leucyl-tRNA synthetase
MVKNSYKQDDNPCGEIIVGPSESMSKSKKNIIDPENIIKNYGADSVRLFILSDSPPEKDVQWSDQGMLASFKFVQKLWALNSKILDKIKDNNQNDEGKNLTKFTNQLINKVTQNLEKFHYNVIVANFYEMYNFLIKETDKPIKKEILIENYKKILILMNPFIPHFSNECLNTINEDQIKWPKVSKGDLIEEDINFVVQINGKKRAILKVKRDMIEKEILETIKSNQEIEKFINNLKIKKSIFVPNRLINIII